MIGQATGELAGKPHLALPWRDRSNERGGPAIGVIDMPFQLPFAAMRGGVGIDRDFEGFLSGEWRVGESGEDTEYSENGNQTRHGSNAGLKESRVSFSGFNVATPPFVLTWLHDSSTHHSSTGGRQ